MTPYQEVKPLTLLIEFQEKTSLLKTYPNACPELTQLELNLIPKAGESSTIHYLGLSFKSAFNLLFFSLSFL